MKQTDVFRWVSILPVNLWLWLWVLLPTLMLVAVIEKLAFFIPAMVLSAQGRLSGAADRLQAAEYAVLADSLEHASAFLDETAAGLDHCRAPVATFYAYWLTAQREGQDETREAAFERWREAVRGYHESNSAGCWDFSGAKSRLSRDPRPRDAARMEEMLDAFNRRR